MGSAGPFFGGGGRPPRGGRAPLYATRREALGALPQFWATALANHPDKLGAAASEEERAQLAAAGDKRFDKNFRGLFGGTGGGAAGAEADAARAEG